MFKQRKFFGVFKTDYFDVFCDVCSQKDVRKSKIEPADSGMLLDNGTIFFHGNTTLNFCFKCFDDGLENYRISDLNYSNKYDEKCVSCGSGLNCITPKNQEKVLKHVCPSCLKQRGHPDNRHAFIETSDRAEGFMSCRNCGTLRRKQEMTYSYWAVGSVEGVSKAPDCNDLSIFRSQCTHDFIVVGDFTTGNIDIFLEEVEAAERGLRKSVPIIDSDPYPVITIHSYAKQKNGFKFLWCKNCGQTKVDVEYKIRALSVKQKNTPISSPVENEKNIKETGSNSKLERPKVEPPISNRVVSENKDKISVDEIVDRLKSVQNLLIQTKSLAESQNISGYALSRLEYCITLFKKALRRKYLNELQASALMDAIECAELSFDPVDDFYVWDSLVNIRKEFEDIF